MPARSLSFVTVRFLVFRTKIVRSCLARGGAWADGQMMEVEIAEARRFDAKHHTVL